MFLSIANSNEQLFCERCNSRLIKVFKNAPEIRTPKTSRTFLDGTKREGFEDLKKIADLQVEQLSHKPNSERYQQINQEINERKKLPDGGKK